MLAVALAAFTVSCSAEPATPPADPAAAAPSASASQAAASPAASSPAAGASPTAVPAEKVRDAFAGLQATLDDSCTPGNCAYFLGRVHDELHRMDRAMKADPKGPGHFPEPIDLIAKLDKELGGDRSFENLKKHQTSLIDTRDKINTWMQAHPDDYR
ncbi:hypothetical protein [Streptomyces sp. NPDC048269]|uniref:hypothetical protein n=1 Tax=Streptomyces sp. NPDC048269 TaxID=3155753 RepID=UPI003424DB9C